MMSKPAVLLLSGYHAASHRYWAEQLTDGLSQYQWTQVPLPDRHFYWRIRSNALTYAFQHPQLHADYDLIVATSMVDLCNLRGLLPHLSAVPTLLYFHENQFVYPQRKANSNLINAQLTSIYSALVSDKLVFNSVYNRDTFFHGARRLLKNMPDGTPKDLLDALPERAVVTPVPIRDEFLKLTTDTNNQPVEILWNHRWEYDKQPEVFFSAIKKLLEADVDLRLHIVGQSFREVPECFTEFRESYPDCILTWGFQTPTDYQQILARSDIVVSAALHDFQGLGMLEAIAAGCIPVAPSRMAYPEYIAKNFLYSVPSLDQSTGGNSGIGSNSGNTSVLLEAEMLYQKLKEIIASFSKPETTMPVTDVERYKRSALLPAYSKLIDGILNRS